MPNDYLNDQIRSPSAKISQKHCGAVKNSASKKWVKKKLEKLQEELKNKGISKHENQGPTSREANGARIGEKDGWSRPGKS